MNTRQNREDRARGLPCINGTGGFSLIELLIVIAIILVIAAIAIPNLLRARISANEASAISSLRNITTGNVVYSTTYNIGYAAQLSYLGGAGAIPTATNSLLLDPNLTAGSKSGYTYIYAAGPVNAVGIIDSYVLQANPIVPNTTGVRYFFVDESGVIRTSSTAPATVTSSPLQ